MELEFSHRKSMVTEEVQSNADWLRSFPDCAHYSDAQAEQVLVVLTQLAADLLEVTGIASVKEEEVSQSRAIPFLPDDQHKAA